MPRLTLQCVALIVFLAQPQNGLGQGSKYPANASELRNRLSRTVNATFEKPFGDVLQSVARSQNIRIFLDRRVDPTIFIKHQAQGETVRQLLHKITAQAKASFCEIRGNIFVGSEDTCHWLASLCKLHQESLKERLTSSVSDLDAKQMLTPSILQWKYLSDPTEIVQSLVLSHGLTIKNPELLVHDRWKEHSLSNLPLSHKLTILLAGFNLTFEWDVANKAIELRPFPSSVVLKSVIPKKLSTANLEKLKSALPDLKIEVIDNAISVEGRFEDIDRLNRLLAGERVVTTTTTNQDSRFTLNVPKAPAEDILAAIANSRKLTLVASDEAKELWTKQISVDVKEVTLEALLDDITTKCGIKWKINDDVLSVFR